MRAQIFEKVPIFTYIFFILFDAVESLSSLDGTQQKLVSEGGIEMNFEEA